MMQSQQKTRPAAVRPIDPRRLAAPPLAEFERKQRDEPAAKIVSGRPSAPWRIALVTLVATLRLWRHRRALRRELAQLDARTLRDVAISPGLVEYEQQQPFWRPLRNWRD